MRKQLLAALFTLITVLLIPVAASASNYDFERGDFVELNGYRFVVLDADKDFLFADFYLENRQFDPNDNNLFNPKNNRNVAYYLNNTFLNNLKGIAEFTKNHNWYINNTTSVEARIALLHSNEWSRHKSLLGIPITDFWLLDYGRLKYFVDKNGNLANALPKTYKAVRPTLYLEPGLYKSGSGSSIDPYILWTDEPVVLSDIKDLALIKTTPTEITLNWKNPKESNFSHLNLYQDGILKESRYKEQTYTFKNLVPSQQYTFTIKAVNVDGAETQGISIVVSTDDVPLLPEVQNLSAVPKHDRVNLSWSNPKNEFFNHVKIYRRVDNQPEETSFLNIFQPIKAYAASGDFDPMFETNGTYWNDLTVQPETTYSYKLSTVNIADVESEGTVVQVTTKEEPAPEIGGGSYTETEEGDFLYTWTQPTTGKVKVLIDGAEYQTVDAANKQILIPKERMVYDLLNNPKVSLIPISESGKEGKPTKPFEEGKLAGVEMPFGPIELLKSSMGLLLVIAPILLLILAIYLVPKIKAAIVQAVQKRKEERRY
ncbi:hypothetical protein J27TS8_27490 [Robertmurraya siralis]|uniref:Fibronectin type-III domain-containing protein n=1 Tax=Robertmurraya siralis TaxID=77777 RepID=A0A919WIP5_9BACI|nr:fibronectin type III domain-containing protein [Robertmurraya siralis]GIN62756.1 hypothetical protein J27TS8_27490 [Robertmurraya siralis]